MTTPIEYVIAWAEREVQDLSPATVNHRYAVVALDALRFKQEAERQPIAPDRAELIAENFDLKLQLQNAKQAIAALSSPTILRVGEELRNAAWLMRQALITNDDEGLIEHAPEMMRVADALAKYDATKG